MTDARNKKQYEQKFEIYHEKSNKNNYERFVTDEVVVQNSNDQ